MSYPRGVSQLAALSLSRDPSSPSRARSFVSSCVSQSGLGALCEVSELVTTELVTNVLVHTDSAPTVRVLVAHDRVRVEVEDGCPVVPVAGILDPTAGSGRGLVLVDQLTHRWGVNRVPEAGKVVWIELVSGDLDEGEELGSDALLDLWDDDAHGAWDDASDPADAGPAEQVRHVRLEDVPTDLLNGTKTHLDDLVRDLTLLGESRASANPAPDLLDLAGRLCHLVAELVGFRNQIRRQVLTACSRGDAVTTLELDLPVSHREHLVEYRRCLDEAEEHCAAGRLLVEVPPPEQVAFRRWKLDRIIEQLGQEAATAAG